VLNGKRTRRRKKALNYRALWISPDISGKLNGAKARLEI
jgi:hypothetical protein